LSSESSTFLHLDPSLLVKSVHRYTSRGYQWAEASKFAGQAHLWWTRLKYRVMASWMPKQAAMTACHLGGCCNSSCHRDFITAVQDCLHLAGSLCPFLSLLASSAHPFVSSSADSFVREGGWEAGLLMSRPDMALVSLPVPKRIWLAGNLASERTE